MLTETNPLILGILCALAGSMVGPIAGDLWRKIKGNEYATKKDCAAQHAREERDCQDCKATTKASICAIQHESAKGKKLMILIAMQVGVEKEDLKEYL